MKKHFISLLSLIIATNISIFATNPDPDYIEVSHQNKKVYVKPHGFDSQIPSRDTRNLQWIFDNLNTYDINLSKGTFHISETIEAVAYQGAIRGRGKNQTALVGRGPLNAEGDYEFPGLNDDLTKRLYPPRVPHLIWFHAADGDVNNWQDTKVALTLEDLSIRLDGVGPIVNLFGLPLRSIWGLVIVTGAEAVITEPKGKISHLEVNVNKVNFESQDVTYQIGEQVLTSPNAALGLIIYGGEEWAEVQDAFLSLNGWTELDHSPVNAQIAITGCTFDNFHQFGIVLESTYTTAPPQVPGFEHQYVFPTSPAFPAATAVIEDNTFVNCGNGAGFVPGFNIFLLALSETHTVIRKNDFLNVPSSGIAMLRGVASKILQLTSPVDIIDNKFRMDATPIAEGAVRQFDFTIDTQQIYLTTIRDNKFWGARGYDRPLNEIGMGANAVIEDNKYFKNAESAITIGSVSPLPPEVDLPATGCVVKGNLFAPLKASKAPVIFGVASFGNTAYVRKDGDVLDNGQGNTVIVK